MDKSSGNQSQPQKIQRQKSNFSETKPEGKFRSTIRLLLGKNEAVTVGTVMKCVDPDKLEELRKLARQELNLFGLLFVENYMSTLLMLEIGSYISPPNNNKIDLRERFRGRRYVGANAAAPKMQGWLKKKGGKKVIGLRRWRDRFFVLSDKTLVYRRPKTPGEIPPESAKAGSIWLGGCHVYLKESYESKASRIARAKAEKQRKKGDNTSQMPAKQYNQNLICLQQPDGRNYLLQASSKFEANEWITAIRKSIQMIPKTLVNKENEVLKRAIWLSYKICCDRLSTPTAPISSAKDAVYSIAKYTAAGFRNQLDELVEELAKNQSDDTVKSVKEKTDSAINKVLDEECKRIWHESCNELNSLLSNNFANIVRSNIGPIKLTLASFDLIIQRNQSEDLKNLMEGIKNICELIGKISSKIIKTFYQHFEEDVLSLANWLKDEVLHEGTRAHAKSVDASEAERMERTDSMFENVLNFFNPTYLGEIEKFVRHYAIRAFHIPWFLTVELEKHMSEFDMNNPQIKSIFTTILQFGKFFGNVKRGTSIPTSQSDYIKEQIDKGLIPSLVSLVCPNEVAQTVARFLQFRAQMKRSSGLNKSTLLEEWMVTIDYTFDLLKDEIEEQEENAIKQLEKRVCQFKHQIFPVDSFLALKRCSDAVSNSVDVGFTVLEEQFAKGIGVEIKDCGTECQGAFGSVKSITALTSFDEAAKKAILSYLHTFGKEIWKVLHESLTHVIQNGVSNILTPESQIEAHKLKQILSYDILTLPNMPDEIKQWINHNLLVEDALRKNISKTLNHVFEVNKQAEMEKPARPVEVTHRHRAEHESTEWEPRYIIGAAPSYELDDEDEEEFNTESMSDVDSMSSKSSET